jgi:hypothetical protein
MPSHAQPVRCLASGVTCALTAWFVALSGCSRTAVTLAPPYAGAGQEVRLTTNAPQESNQATAATEGFRLPDDHGGELLAKVLTPEVRPATQDDLTGPRRFPRSPAVETPAIPVPPGQADVVRLPRSNAGSTVRPGPLPEDLPLAGYHDTPPPPEPKTLLTGERVRVPSEDVNQPVPLPLLGQVTPDRAPLDAPTAEHSLAAAVAAQMPARTNPAPFVKLTVPDPFENRQTVRLPAMPPEEVAPARVSRKP